MANVVQSQEVREAILDAADRLLGSYGYKKMTIDDLAREVGIGKGSVYLHFPSKREIALAHVDRIVERVTNELAVIADSRVKPAEKLRRMLAARILIRFDSVHHYTRNLNELLADLRPQLIERRKRHFAEEAEIVARVIDEGQRKGEFRAKRSGSIDLAESLLLATNSLLPLSLTARELGRRREVREKVLRLAELLLTGLEK